jgi:hypothetical protein
MDKIDWNELFEEETSELKNHMKKKRISYISILCG